MVVTYSERFHQKGLFWEVVGKGVFSSPVIWATLDIELVQRKPQKASLLLSESIWGSPGVITRSLGPQGLGRYYLTKCLSTKLDS